MSSRELVAIFHQFAEKSHGLAPAAAEILHKFEEILQIFSLSLSPAKFEGKNHWFSWNWSISQD